MPGTPEGAAKARAAKAAKRQADENEEPARARPRADENPAVYEELHEPLPAGARQYWTVKYTIYTEPGAVDNFGRKIAGTEHTGEIRNWYGDRESIRRTILSKNGWLPSGALRQDAPGGGISFRAKPGFIIPRKRGNRKGKTT